MVLATPRPPLQELPRLALGMILMTWWLHIPMGLVFGYLLDKVMARPLRAGARPVAVGLAFLVQLAAGALYFVLTEGYLGAAFLGIATGVITGAWAAGLTVVHLALIEPRVTRKALS